MRPAAILAAAAAATLLACRPGGSGVQTSAPSAANQAPLSTDIYLLRFASGGRPHAVFNITNRIGYDNQPSWLSNSRLVFTAQREGQTDIEEIDFESSRSRRLVTTPESEYSPTLTPDGKAISVIRVEADSTQRLWRFPLDGGSPSVILPDIRPVGYHAWLDSTTLALFVLGSPNTLQIADVRTGTAAVAASGIGRSLQRIPGGRRVSFVQRSGRRWVLKAASADPLPTGGFAIDSLTILPDSAEYVVWRSPTELYTAAGSRVFRLSLPGADWEEVVDLAGQGVRGISRIALSPDRSRLALVAEDVPRPQ